MGAAGRLLGASRRSAIPSFKVMDVLARARALEQAGERVYHLEVGQPQAGAPEPAIAAARAALAGPSAALGYTDTRGIPALREAIVRMCETRYAARVDASRVHVTTGSSSAFQLAFTACFDAGDAVAVTPATYPCYRNVLLALGCEVVVLPASPACKFTAAAPELRACASARAAAGLAPLAGAVIASPSNPTGVTLSRAEVRELCVASRELGVRLVSDEIYHGLHHTPEPCASALAEDGGADGARSAELAPREGGPVVIGSFSKYHCMTGWRVGWMAVPPELDDAVLRLAQSYAICAPAIGQHAALGALSDEARPELQRLAQRYTANRARVLAGLRALGVAEADVAPADGAFYAYADVGAALAARAARGVPTPATADALCAALLEDASTRVAITPGADFEDPASGLGERRVRVSYAGSEAEVDEAMSRIERWWAAQ